MEGEDFLPEMFIRFCMSNVGGGVERKRKSCACVMVWCVYNIGRFCNGISHSKWPSCNWARGCSSRVDVVMNIFLERFPSPATPSAAAPVPCALKRSRRRPLLEPVGLL